VTDIARCATDTCTWPAVADFTAPDGQPCCETCARDWPAAEMVGRRPGDGKTEDSEDSEVFRSETE